MKKTIKKNLKIHIRTGDRVKILAGKHRNEQGTVVKVFPKAYRAIVEGMNIVLRHVKPSPERPTGVIQKQPSPIHISNLMLIDPISGGATRVGRKHNASGKLQRYAKKTGNFIQNV
ncbi:50S ribosomal protein L24 [Cardinium endosymbiont of Oedothorax gibbosus]|uniref:50S ribosomal protein L24 n=1 Tax=Cardinium endosymbiont of Oedothorax gibbosus TaxID=931101 RepID=UPI00202533AC|nr:50S ribosomal protein L24 [Cardinium endosymbiont of Oedothorax gibbosus]CAH2559726.1 50S ribosomal protein L24 [Cardinium endosymbiont of Oedothorax gibbosus]